MCGLRDKEMRSYYESFGAALGGESTGESSPAEEHGWGRAVRRSENAGTGGISSDSKDREESESWAWGATRAPMRQPASDGWSEDGAGGGLAEQ